MASAQALSGQTYDGLFVSCISPNGQYTASNPDGEVAVVLDLFNNKSYVYDSTSDEGAFGPGNGNAFSNNGILAGSVRDMAMIWNNGEVILLPEYKNAGGSMSYADGVTPDGTRVCGEVSPAKVDMDGTMLVPCYWDINADGTISEPVLLPYPDKDYSNRAPQYITAIAISEDGKTIMGQVRDYRGAISYPIRYTQDENGEWSYSLPGYELINPSHLEFPEDPGEAPQQPNYADYMSEEEYAMYQEDYQAWAAGGYNPDLWPDPLDYMDEEQLEAYNEAMEKYKEEAAIYNEKLDAFYTVLNQVLDESPAFEFNSMVMSPNAKLFATAAAIFNPETWEESTYPYIFLEDGSYLTYDEQVSPSCIFDNGVFMATKLGGGFFDPTPYSSYVGDINLETTTLTPLYDYLELTKPEMAEWLKENCTVTITNYDEEWNEVEEEVIVTGYAQATADFSTVIGAAHNTWDYTASNFFSYTMTYGESSGISNVEALNGEVKALRGGNLVVNNAVAAVEIYTLDGAKVFADNAPANNVATGLGRGIYVLKATMTDGTTKSQKVVF